MAKPQIHHTTTPDGARIAYWTQGSGPALVYIGVPCCSHVQIELDLSLLMDWYGLLARDYRLVRLDMRGYGASQRDNVEIGVEPFKRDILAVADALDIERFAILTQGGSAPAAISLAAESNRVSALVICDGWADGPNLDVHRRVAAAQSLAEADYRMFSEVMAKVVLGAPDAFAAPIARLLRLAAGPDTWRAFAELMWETDVTPCLKQIACPVLVIHSGPGPLTGMGETSLALAESIRGATFANINQPNFPLGETADALATIFSFLGNAVGRSPARNEPTLSAREFEVLDLIAQGKTNQQIAEALVIAPPTVARHVHNLLTKLDLSNRTEAAAWAAGRNRAH